MMLEVQSHSLVLMDIFIFNFFYRALVIAQKAIFRTV